MKKWLLRLGLILGVLLVLATSIYAIDWFGVMDVRSKVYDVPVVSKLMPVEKNKSTKSKTSELSQLTKDNIQLKTNNAGLKANNADLKQKINKLESQTRSLQTEVQAVNKKHKAVTADKTNLLSEVSKMKIALADAQKAQEEGLTRSKSYEQLAGYYAAMKAKDAVKSLTQLDDDTVIGILTKLDNDQAAAILANFAPDRAAKIVRNMSTQ